MIPEIKASFMKFKFWDKLTIVYLFRLKNFNLFTKLYRYDKKKVFSCILIFSKIRLKLILNVWHSSVSPSKLNLFLK